MVPARLNFLLPHISLLMKPIVFALNGSTETALFALKKLETWVENLQPGYFDPLLQVVAGRSFEHRSNFVPDHSASCHLLRPMTYLFRIERHLFESAFTRRTARSSWCPR